MIPTVETLLDGLANCEYDRMEIGKEEARLEDELVDLEKEMGDEAFHEAMKEYYKDE